MAILPVNLYGDQILKKKATLVQKIDQSVITLINDMFATMRNADGIGLAANQVGSNYSIIVIDISLLEGFEDSKPLFFINPKIVWSSEEEIEIEEGCLSLPNLRAKVFRPESIKIEFQDMSLSDKTLEASGILARVIQHEYDHLQGIVFTDRIDEETKKMVKKSLTRIKNRKIDIDYLVTGKPV